MSDTDTTRKPTGEDAVFLLTILECLKEQGSLNIDWKLVGARSGYITAKGARERFQQLEIGGSTGASSSTSTSSIPTSSSAAASTKEKVGTEVETTRKIDEGQDADMEWVDVGELEDNGSEYGDIVIGLNIARPRATLVLD